VHQLVRPDRFSAPPLKYTREGLRKDHLQQLVRSSSWRAALNWRARKHAVMRLNRAHKHEQARAGFAGGMVERCESRSPIFKFKSSLKTSAIAFHAAVFGVHEAPCSTGRSSKGQLQQQRVM
jgi:hypothetical protein